MSIATKTGDHGTTGLMYNRRVSKCDPQVEACGAVDELNAALGLARAALQSRAEGAWILEIQKALVALMGELATTPEDLPRYQKDGYPLLSAAHIGQVDRWLEQLESGGVALLGWAMPGDSAASAALDFARTVCRRAERRVCAVVESGRFQNRDAVAFLNRLADLLWLLARHVTSAA